MYIILILIILIILIRSLSELQSDMTSCGQSDARVYAHVRAGACMRPCMPTRTSETQTTIIPEQSAHIHHHMKQPFSHVYEKCSRLAREWAGSNYLELPRTVVLFQGYLRSANAC